MAAGCAGIRLTGPFRAGPDDWVMYGGSMQRNNASASIIKPPLRELWEYNALGGISGTPVVRDSIVLIGTLHGELQAISLLNGKRLGYVVFESAIKGSPVLDGTNVIVAVSNGSETLVSYSLRSGTRVWSRPYGAIESAPLLSGDLLYVTTLDGYLNCIKKNDGTEVWKYAPEDNRKPIRSSPASDGQTVFFGGDNGVLAAVGGDGQLKWRVQTGASIFATPIVTGEVVVVGNLNGNCYGVRKSDGTLLWNVGLGAPMYGAAAASNGRVFVAAADGVVRALDEFTGQEHWAFSTGSVVNSAPLIAGTMLFIGSLDKTLYVIDVEQGREIWKLEVPGRLKVSPVLWKNTLLLAVEDKYIIALEPE
jgi:outer membrane protein assembly factor BamB